MNYSKLITPIGQRAFFGLDVHQATITISIAVEFGSVNYLTTIDNKPEQVIPFFLLMKTRYDKIYTTYEAGGCGDALHRLLTQMDIHNIICAPSRIAKKPGKQKKNDKKDSMELTDLLRRHILLDSELAEVYVHDLEDLEIRELTRYRDAKKRLAKVVQNQILAFLRRYGMHYRDGGNWTNPFWLWLGKVELPSKILRMHLDSYINDLKALQTQIVDLDKEIVALSDWRRHAVVKALVGLRGVSWLTATNIVAEIGDFSRFKKASHFMAYLGLTPSEYSSGERVTANRVDPKKVRHGGITKEGNGIVRRHLVEVATHASKRVFVSKDLQARREGLETPIIDHCNKASRRLHRVYLKHISKGKNTKLIRVAVARELAGFIWAIARMAEENANLTHDGVPVEPAPQKKTA